MSIWVTFSPFCVLLNAFSFDGVLSLFFFYHCPLQLKQILLYEHYYCVFFYQFYLQGAKFFSSVEFFLLMFLIKGPKLLGMSQGKSTTNANTKKKYITKSVSWSLIKLFLFTTRTKNLQRLHAPWKFLNFKIKI